MTGAPSGAAYLLTITTEINQHCPNLCFSDLLRDSHHTKRDMRRELYVTITTDGRTEAGPPAVSFGRLPARQMCAVVLSPGVVCVVCASVHAHQTTSRLGSYIRDDRQRRPRCTAADRCRLTRPHDDVTDCSSWKQLLLSGLYRNCAQPYYSSRLPPTKDKTQIIIRNI